MSNNKNNIIAIVILSAVILLLCILCVTLVYEGKKEKSVNNTEPTYNTTELATEKRTIPTSPTQASIEYITKATAPFIISTQPATIDIGITTPPTEEATIESITESHSEKSPTEAETENPEDNLIQLIKGSGYNLRDMELQGIEQLIVITTDAIQTNAYMFTFSDGKWNDKKLTCKAYVGSAGIGEKETDNDNITPKGLYMLGDAFYTTVQPSTWLNTFVITENTYWITDSKSEMYNKKVESKQSNDFENAIHMIDKANYKYGCVINYNTNPIVRGKGSAIFMHCGTDETNGSVALKESDLLKFLEILNSEKKPAILIF